MDRLPETSRDPGAKAKADRAFSLGVGAWLVPFAFIGAALVFVYPDCYQADGGYHYNFARWGLVHRALLVDVWGRPLFTLLYALPAQLGYPVAKLLTVAISVLAAWHTAWLAREEGLLRAELSVPLLFLQPSFLLVCSDTMTEPLFALLLVIALRVHRRGRVREGMQLAALLPLARPEGFFVALLWGAFVALDGRRGGAFVRRLLSTSWLAAGVLAWWLLALFMTRDPLFILHNWPKNWDATATYGKGPLLQYWIIRDEVLSGRLLWVLLGLGAVGLVLLKRLWLATSSMVLVWVLHSIFFRLGYFGSAGYARYLVCVAPPMALSMLEGWNMLAGVLRPLPRPLARLASGLAVAALVLFTGYRGLRYLDSMEPSRDERAVKDSYDWFRAHEVPVKRLVFSQVYMSILFGRDPAERPQMGSDRERNLELLRESQPGTLVFWDAHTGPLFRHLVAADLEGAGYTRLHAARCLLGPRFPWLHDPPARSYEQEMFLYYKER